MASSHVSGPTAQSRWLTPAIVTWWAARVREASRHIITGSCPNLVSPKVNRGSQR